jgi:hypothetical protein
MKPSVRCTYLLLSVPPIEASPSLLEVMIVVAGAKIKKSRRNGE